MPVTTISTLIEELREILIARPLTKNQLDYIFTVNAELRHWKAQLPENTNSVEELVNAIIVLLFEKRTEKGDCALVIFVRAYADNGVGAGNDANYNQLQRLANSLEVAFKPIPDQPETEIVTSDSTNSTSKYREWLIGSLGLGVVLIVLIVALDIVPAVDKVIPITTTQITTNLTPTSSPTLALIIGSSQTSTVDDMVQMYVPAGTFTMGSYDDNGHEYPEHPVYLDAFWIDKYEITNAQFQSCVIDDDCSEPIICEWGKPTYNEVGKEHHPVVCVNWQNAQNYCVWAGRTLPTEAQWEKAARGTDGRIYPWGEEFDSTRLNFCDELCPYEWADGTNDMYASTAPIGTYSGGASPYEALDMAGNVMEWTLDWYIDNFYREGHATNPIYLHVTETRVMRGGSWRDKANGLRSFDRSHLPPLENASYLGFRCAENIVE